MKVDIELLRKAQEIRRQYPMFCNECGETNPPNLFYPMSIFGPNSVSDLICNDCEREIRERLKGDGES